MAPTKPILFKEVDKSKQSKSSVRDDMLEKVSDTFVLELCDELKSIFGTEPKMSRKSYNAGAEELKSTATDLDDLDDMQKVVKDADAKLFTCNDGKVASEDETLDVVGASKDGAPSNDTTMDVNDITNGNDTTSKSTTSDTTTKIVDDSDGGGKYILLFEFLCI